MKRTQAINELIDAAEELYCNAPLPTGAGIAGLEAYGEALDRLGNALKAVKKEARDEKNQDQSWDH